MSDRPAFTCTPYRPKGYARKVLKVVQLSFRCKSAFRGASERLGGRFRIVFLRQMGRSAVGTATP